MASKVLEHDESTLKAGKGKQCASRLSYHRFCINVYDAITRCQTGHIALQSGPYQRAVWPFWPCHTAGFQSPCAPVGYVPGIQLFARLDDFRRILLQNAVAPLIAACTKKPHAPALKLAYAALHVGVKPTPLALLPVLLVRCRPRSGYSVMLGSSSR